MNESVAHVANRFDFVLGAPLHRVAPLFGPESERCWAGEGWNPEFLHPQPGADVEGAVFTIERRGHKSVWVNTQFDVAGGRFQYVSFVPGVVVSTVSVRLSSVASGTRVEVAYARTALDSGAIDEVHAMGTQDRGSGPQWQEAIEACLQRK